MVFFTAVALLQGQVSNDLMPTGQALKPYGEQLLIQTRPVDLALSPDKKWLVVKQNKGISVVRTSDWSKVADVPMKGASLYGLAFDAAGDLFFSDARSTVSRGTISDDGQVRWTHEYVLPKPSVGGEAYPCAMAALPSGQLAVCASRSNAIVLFDRDVPTSIKVNPCPYAVASPDGQTLWVTCWGRTPKKLAAKSSGTEVDVDERGITTGGTVDIIDLKTRKVVNSLRAGLQPSQIVSDGKYAYVANASSDTVGVYDVKARKLLRDFVVKPDPKLPFGSAPNALALDSAGQRLYISCGGNNALAVASAGSHPKILGWIPTSWYPGPVLCDGGKLYVGSIKGIGARSTTGDRHRVYDFTGTIARFEAPDAEALKTQSAIAIGLASASQILQSYIRSKDRSVPPLPVPKQLGEPSPIQHVVYIVKENRTYDQVLGDLGRGNGDPKLTIYGSDVTPNHHALANEFVLLDNFYCNGTVSADGHTWLTSGSSSNYLERSFGGWTRSYPFGVDDPLASLPSGYIWDAVLAAGLSFRNYGEGTYTDLPANTSWKSVCEGNKSGKPLEATHRIENPRLKLYSAPTYPGWNLTISDQVRADIYLSDFKNQKEMPSLTMVYLEQDHTAGLTPGMPTPQAMVADNDLALGRIIDSISHSKFWASTAIFVIEDDAQDGFDHVDGHRSCCFVISPYTRRGAIISDFHNQTGVVHTILQMLGVKPLTQLDAQSALFSDCFNAAPNLRPYDVKPNRIPLDTLNTPKKASSLQRAWMGKSKRLDLKTPDASDEDLLNRMQWIAVKGSKPYPRTADKDDD